MGQNFYDVQRQGHLCENEEENTSIGLPDDSKYMTQSAYLDVGWSSTRCGPKRTG